MCLCSLLLNSATFLISSQPSCLQGRVVQVSFWFLVPSCCRAPDLMLWMLPARHWTLLQADSWAALEEGKLPSP